MPTFPRKTPRHRPDRSRRAGPPRSGAEATPLVDGAATTGLCVGLAALLQVWPAGPIPAGAILTGLLASAGYLWLAVAITEDDAGGDPRRATGWDVSAWNVTAWDVALVLLAVQVAAPLGA